MLARNLPRLLVRPVTRPLVGSQWGLRTFASTVAAWFDGGAPGRFVPTYRDWQTSGALYQDLVGTPVTALEQFVALNLDRSRKLARSPQELMSNGDFAAAGAGWTVTNADATHIVTFATGSMRYQSDTVTPVLSVQATMTAPLVNGRIYEVTVDVAPGITGRVKTDRFGGAALIATAGVTKTVMQCISGGALNLYRDTINVDATIRSISVREILGTHRIMATPQSRTILTARKNRFDNSAWLGGGSLPTSWSQIGPTGTSAPNGTIDGNVIYRQTTVAQRLFFAAATLPVSVGQIWTLSVDVPNIYSGSSALNNLILPLVGGGGSAGPIAYYVDGVLSTGGALATAGTRVTAQYTCTVAGTIQPRVGLGSSSAVTCDLDLVRPMMTFGPIEQAGRYQRTGLTGTVANDYDAAGFPVGLRYDGIDDGQTTATTIDLSGTPYLSIAGAWRPESRVGTQLLVESSPVYSTNEGAIEVSMNEINADALVFSRRVGGTVQYRHQGAGQPSPPKNVTLTGRMNSTLPAPADVEFKVNGVLAPLTGGTPNSAPALGNWKWSYGRRELGGLYYAGLEYGDFCIGLARTDEQMAYLDAQFALNFSEVLP